MKATKFSVALVAALLAAIGVLHAAASAPIARSKPQIHPSAATSPTGKAPVTAPTEHSPYIGLRYGALPAGFESTGGSVLDPEMLYSVTHVRDSRQDMLWLARLLELDAEGLPTHEVRAVLAIDHLSANQRFEFGGQCKVGGVDDRSVVAVTPVDDTKSSLPAVRAWRVDFAEERFTEISVDNVECGNEIGISL